jgi:hypothetical protein
VLGFRVALRADEVLVDPMQQRLARGWDRGGNDPDLRRERVRRWTFDIWANLQVWAAQTDQLRVQQPPSLPDGLASSYGTRRLGEGATWTWWNANTMQCNRCDGMIQCATRSCVETGAGRANHRACEEIFRGEAGFWLRKCGSGKEADNAEAQVEAGARDDTYKREQNEIKASRTSETHPSASAWKTDSS